MDDDFQTLDRRVVSLWRWHSVVSTLVFAIIGLGGCTAAVVSGESFLLFVPVVLVIVVIAIVGMCWHPRAAFQRWRFRISKKAIVLNSGVIFQKEVHVPMDRVQHVDLERGPLERRCGLARLIFFTAGTKAARQEIPGLAHEEALRLRDQIANDLDTARRDV